MSFSDIISKNAGLKSKIINEFGVSESVIRDWANDKSTPNILMQKALLMFIAEEKAYINMPNELRALKLKLIKDILVKYDPAHLDSNDNYDFEANEIMHHLPGAKSCQELSSILWAIIVCNDSIGRAGDFEYYRLIAADIWSIKRISMEDIYADKIRSEALSAMERAKNAVKDVKQTYFAKIVKQTYFAKMIGVIERIGKINVHI
jgi:hypothetical protein